MTSKYDGLLNEAKVSGADIIVKKLKGRNRGLYGEGLIVLDARLSTAAERLCILAEELGHHYTSVGNILDQTKICNRKQELRARSWAYDRLITLADLITADKSGVRNQFELAQYLEVTEDFLSAALNRLKERHGVAVYHDGFLIEFDPLQVFEPYSEINDSVERG